MKLGYLGEKISITSRQGASLGPFRARMTNTQDNTPVNLTDCTIRGSIRRTATDPVLLASFNVTITDPVDGRYEFGLLPAVTAALPSGATVLDPEGKMEWDLELVDSQGRITPLYFGPFINVSGVTHSTPP